MKTRLDSLQEKLEDAAFKGNINEITNTLIEAERHFINTASSDQLVTPLMMAIIGNKVEAALLLCEKGADITLCDSFNRDAIRLAILFCPDIVPHLKARDATLSKAEECIYAGEFIEFKELLAEGKEDTSLRVLLNIAAANGREEIVRMLTGHSEIIIKDLKKWNEKPGMLTNHPLYLATARGHLKIIELLSSYENINFKYFLECCKLAATRGDIDSFKFFKKRLFFPKKFHVDIGNKSERIHAFMLARHYMFLSLVNAIQYGHIPIIKYILDKYNRSVVFEDIKTRKKLPAVINIKTKIKKPLINKKAYKIHKKHGPLEDHAIHIAVKENNLGSLQYLIEERKVKADVKDCDGDTPLHKAIENKHEDIIQYLITCNPLLLFIKNNNGISPMQLLDKKNIPKKSIFETNKESLATIAAALTQNCVEDLEMNKHITQLVKKSLKSMGLDTLTAKTYFLLQETLENTLKNDEYPNTKAKDLAFIDTFTSTFKSLKKGKGKELAA